MDKDSNDINGRPFYTSLYEIANVCLSNGYSVLYGVESAPHEASKERILGNIENASSSKQARDNISKGFLEIVDIDSIREQCGISYDSLVEFWNSHAKVDSQTVQNSGGTILFSSPDSYFKDNLHDTFFLFEAAMGKTFSTSKSMICWYRDKWLKGLPLASLIKILTTHEYTIHNGLKYKEWTKNEIINTISQGIDRQLGEDSAILLFRTMNCVHKLNADNIISKPIVFEEMLKRMLEYDDSANSVINSIFDQFVRKIAFVQDVSRAG